MNIRLVLSAVLVVVVVGTAAIGSATSATFTDSGTAKGTIQAGTLDLQMSDAFSVFVNDLTSQPHVFTWNLPNAAPGGPQQCRTVTLRNWGSITGSKVRLSVVNSGTGGTAMAQEIIATSLSYGDLGPVLGMIPDADGHPGVSMRDFELLGTSGLLFNLPLNAQPPFGIDGTQALSMCLQFHADAPNSLQGQSWIGTFTFTLIQ